MLQAAYLAHGGQMTGDEMALVGVGLAGALIIPMAAMAFIFLNKRSAPDDAMPPESPEDAMPPEAHVPPATYETTGGSVGEVWGRR